MIRKIILLVGFFCFFSAFSKNTFAWNPFVKENRNVKKGNTLIAKGNFQEALKSYNAASGEHPENPAVDYDKGIASYKIAMKDSASKQQKLEEAASAFLSAIDRAGSENKDLKAKSFYNLGNVYFAQERYKEAVEAYRQSLKLMPGYEDAAFNLSVALKKIEEQKKKEEEQKKQEEKENKENQNQEKKPDENQKDDSSSPDKQKPEENQSKEKQQEQKGQEQQKEQESKKEVNKKENEGESQKENKGEEMKQNKAKEEAQQEQTAQKEENNPVPLSKQQAQAILDALQNNEKNYFLENMRKMAGAKQRVLKDW